MSGAVSSHQPHARLRRFKGALDNELVASIRGPDEGRRVVLLLHGGGQTRHAWDATARALAGAGWIAVALDQRGHGDSAWIADGSYSFSDYATDVVTVADTLAKDYGVRPVLVGASLGGIASMLALSQRPDLAAGLILVDVTPRMDASGVAHVQGFMRAKAHEGFASIEEAADAIAAYLPHRPRPKSLEGLRKNLRHGSDGRWRWHWDPRMLDGPRPVDKDRSDIQLRSERALHEAKLPLLLVRGRSSELVTEEAAASFRAVAPEAEYADIAGARHMVAGDRNDAFSAAILDFLERRF